MDRFKQWFTTKVLEPGKSYITSGTEPTTLALSAAVGWCCGLCPLLGVSAGLCCLAIVVSRGRLHGPMTLLANLLSVPVELLMIPVYMRIGGIITGAPRQTFPRISVGDLFGPGGAELLRFVGRALLAWVITWPLLVGALYFALTPVFAWMQTRHETMRGAVVLSGRRYRTRHGAVVADEYSSQAGSPEGIQPLMTTSVSTDESVAEVGLVHQGSSGAEKDTY